MGVGRRVAQVVGLGSVLLALLGVPATASANEVSELVERCAHGQPLGGFRPSAYAEALRHLPTVLLEYSNCEEQLREAELQAATVGGALGSPTAAGPGSPAAAGGAAAGGLLGGLPSGAGEPPLPAPPALEQQLQAASRRPPAQAVAAGLGIVRPGAVPVAGGRLLDSLPTVILAAIGAVAAAALVLGAVAVRSRTTSKGP